RARAAAVMSLAPSGQAFIGGDLHQYRIALDGAADAEPDVLAFRHAVGDRDCLDRCNTHGVPHGALCSGLTRLSGRSPRRIRSISPAEPTAIARLLVAVMPAVC